MKKPKEEEVIGEDIKEVVEEVEIEDSATENDAKEKHHHEHHDEKEPEVHSHHEEEHKFHSHHEEEHKAHSHHEEEHKAHSHHEEEHKFHSHEKAEEHDAQHSGEHHHKEVKHAHEAKPAKEVKHHTNRTSHNGSLKDKILGKPWLYASILVGLVIIAFGWNYSNGADDTNELMPGDSLLAADHSDFISSESARLEFYVMSQCPYGTQVEDGIADVLTALGDSVNFTIDYIANDNGDGKFSSLHGQPEVNEDMRQLCAMKYNPDKYMDFIICQNKDIRNADKTFNKCADSAGVDYESIKACFEGKEGAALLSESIKKAQAREASGSPTIYLDGEPYSGKRDSDSFLKAICTKIEHPSCDGLPTCSDDTDCPAKEGKIPKCLNPGTEEAECSYVDPVKVYMVVLNDKECDSCNTTRIVEVTKQLFPGVEIENVDISSENGKAVAEMYDIVYLPAYILTKELEDTNTWKNNQQVKGAFEKVGENYKLLDAATGATHFADKEVEAEFVKSIGVTLGDNRPQIDFFIMSFCPYGNQAEELIGPVYDLLGKYADFNPHWVIYSNYQGGGDKFCMDKESKYCSMHGAQEMREDIREACVNKYVGTKEFFDFAFAMNKECSASNADACWKDVAEGLGLDTDMIEKCLTDEGKAIAEADLQLGSKLGVRGSPSIFIDGIKFNGERSEEGYKAGLCAAFDKAPDACGETLAAAGSAKPAGSCN